MENGDEQQNVTNCNNHVKWVMTNTVESMSLFFLTIMKMKHMNKRFKANHPKK